MKGWVRMEFLLTLKNYREKIDNEIVEFLDKEEKKYPNLHIRKNIQYLKDYMLLGGKKLRPISMVMSYLCFNDNLDRILKTSLSIEFLHTSTLIFDDLMDEDDYRRGKKGIQLKFKEDFVKEYKEMRYEGNIFSQSSKRYSASRSMLVGLLCEMYYRRTLLESGFGPEKVNKAIELFDASYEELINGQTLDVVMENLKNVSKEEYLNMIYLKTGSLFVHGIMIGAMLADATDNQIKAMGDYAR